MNTNEVEEQVITAAGNNMTVCSVCHKVHSDTQASCTRCGNSLGLRKSNSIQHSSALLIAALVMYIPANVYPIMTTNFLGVESETTILGGIFLFIKHESYGIAIIIFLASVVIPMAKIGALFVLCLAAVKRSKLSGLELTKLYRIVEFVGKWSMVDVFVVAILVGLVQLGKITSIEPGTASIAFTTVVILTIVAAQRFDPRLMWDRLEE